MSFNLPAIYPITNSVESAFSVAEQVDQMILGGARFIQIRDKSAASGKFLSDVRDAIQIAHRFGAKIIVNDRVDIAIAAKADGVHLGQSDLPPKQARKLLGDGLIIGYSTHSVDQAKAALNEPIDYIAIGPVFETSTKADHDPVTGLNIVRFVRKIIDDFPLVAIGGITHENAQTVLDAGANSVAVIGAIHANNAISHNTSKLLASVKTICY